MDVGIYMAHGVVRCKLEYEDGDATFPTFVLRAEDEHHTGVGYDVQNILEFRMPHAVALQLRDDIDSCLRQHELAEQSQYAEYGADE